MRLEQVLNALINYSKGSVSGAREELFKRQNEKKKKKRQNDQTLLSEDHLDCSVEKEKGRPKGGK